MAQGVLYVRSLYPGDIAVQEKKAFEILIEGKLAIAIVGRHIMALTINDFNNAVEVTNEGEKQIPKLRAPITAIDRNIAAFDGSPDRLLLLVDYTQSDYRQFTARAFSEVVIAFDIDVTEPGDKELEFHEVVLQTFIRAYRHASKDVSISMPDRLLRDIPIRMISAVPYCEAELQMPVRERLIRPRSLRFGIKKSPLRSSRDIFLRRIPRPKATQERLRRNSGRGRRSMRATMGC